MATRHAVHGAERIAAVDTRAARAGVHPGQPLTHARAVCPALEAVPADPPADARLLGALARWCTRATPWARTDGADGLLLDISGCAHLFGGEAILLADLLDRLAADGFAVRGALAGTVGAAWALARLAPKDRPIINPGAEAHRAALARLPTAALRLDAATVDGLARMGLKRIEDLYGVARAPLTKRFGDGVLARLDAALGRRDEPVDPAAPAEPLLARRAFAEPIGTIDDIEAGLAGLLETLCADLEHRALGARRLVFALHRVDGGVSQASVGTVRPVRDPVRLARLFRDALNTLDAGFGADVLTLWAAAVEPLSGAQADFQADGPDRTAMADLIDRLSARLGQNAVRRIELRARHVPEHAARPVSVTKPRAPAIDATDQQSRQPRPVRLLAWPQPIDVIAPVPDHPPVAFKWRGHTRRIAAAEGPERIGPEWWLLTPGDADARTSEPRDYYRIEDGDGGRYWVYREGVYRADRPARWYLHGVFA